jgi:hypothetical protein
LIPLKHILLRELVLQEPIMLIILRQQLLYVGPFSSR